MQEVFGYFPHHIDGMYLARVVLDNAVWQSLWRQIAVQSASWYSTPPGKVGRQFTALMDVEWRVVLDQKWNSEIPLVFSHVVMTRTLGACKAREIRARINCQLDLLERDIHAYLVGDLLARGRFRG